MEQLNLFPVTIAEMVQEAMREAFERIEKEYMIASIDAKGDVHYILAPKK